MLVGLIIFVGAGLGGLLRHLINQFSSGLLGNNLPYGTFIVNILGSLAMGILVTFFAVKSEPYPFSRLFLTTGILGGFTTFSAFSLEIVTFYQRNQTSLAVCYSILSILFSVSALFMGMWITKILVN